jgi:hypothetical protein
MRISNELANRIAAHLQKIFKDRFSERVVNTIYKLRYGHSVTFWGNMSGMRYREFISFLFSPFLRMTDFRSRIILLSIPIWETGMIWKG